MQRLLTLSEPHRDRCLCAVVTVRGGIGSLLRLRGGEALTAPLPMCIVLHRLATGARSRDGRCHGRQLGAGRRGSGATLSARPHG